MSARFMLLYRIMGENTFLGGLTLQVFLYKQVALYAFGNKLSTRNFVNTCSLVNYTLFIKHCLHIMKY